MARNSPEGDKKRQAARRARQRDAGLVSLTVQVPAPAKPLIKSAVDAMRAGIEPRLALRQAGGSNQPDDPPSPTTLAPVPAAVPDLVTRMQAEVEIASAKAAAEATRRKAEKLALERDEARRAETMAVKARDATVREKAELDQKLKELQSRNLWQRILNR